MSYLVVTQARVSAHSQAHVHNVVFIVLCRQVLTANSPLQAIAVKHASKAFLHVTSATNTHVQIHQRSALKQDTCRPQTGCIRT